MGLNASVMCTCYARGQTATPPTPERVRLDADCYLMLDLPWEGHAAEHEAFDTWRRSACAHEDMCAASEHISNWSGYRLFQEALGEVGWVHFPTLRAALPETNGGVIKAAESALCLKELAEFERHYRAEVSVLFETASGAALHDHVRSYQGIFVHSSIGLDVGVDDEGLFVREAAAPHRERFRAMRIEQRPSRRSASRS
jgi:hypothetical protein